MSSLLLGRRRTMIVRIAAAVIATVVVSASPAGASFPGGNGLIAFQTPGGIGVARPGGTPRLLGPVSIRASFRYPAWSPDGTRLTFIRDERVCVMDADGTNVRCVGVKDRGTAWPTWSPDNATVVFERRSDIWSIDVDAPGAVAVNLTTTSRFNEGYPAVSPDGALIAYDRFSSGSLSQIYVMAPDGSNVQRLTDPAMASHDPDWSPDGARILFQLYVDAATNVLAVMERDGSDPTVIFRRSVADAVYSPNGRRIAFTRLTGPNLIPRIWGIRADGTDLRRLVSDDDGGHYSFPSWQPTAI